MRVLAARFPDRHQAAVALGALQQRLRLSNDDAAIAPLGTPGEREMGDETLLAGHFRDEQTDLVRWLVRRSGGEVVADVDEQWTRPTVAAPPPGPQYRVRPHHDTHRGKERQPVTQ